MKTKILSSAMVGLLLAAAGSPAVAGPVALSTIFADQFNRSNSNTVGNSWIEINHDPNEVAIIDNALKLSGQVPGALGTVASPDAAATHTISTVGFHNVSIQFSWAALTASEASDILGVAWKRSSDTTYTNLDTFGLGGDGSYTTASYNLGALANNTSIDLRFWTNVNEDNEGALIDSVTVTAVPEPSTMALLAICLLGAGVARRRPS